MNALLEAAFDLDDMLPEQHLHRIPRILLVEDDAMIRLWISEVLTLSGYHVDTAEDGENGWNKFHAASYEQNGYDLLITDNNMPKLTGVELINKLRAGHVSVPIILASGSPPRNVEWLELNALLQKPFSANQLVETVKKILGPLQRENARRTNSVSEH